MTRAVLAAAAVVALVGVPVGSSRASAPAVPRIEPVPTAVSSLLADYSRAWRRKDEGLLRATVAPALRGRELAALRAAHAVPFTRLDVAATTQFSGNLASRRVAAMHRGAEVATYNVYERSRIGPETSTYLDDGAFTFVRTGERDYEGWRIASKDDLDVLGFFSPHHLWDEGEVTVLRSRSFVLLTHPDVARELRPLLHVVEEAYSRVRAFWPAPLHGRYVIVVPSTPAELGRVVHETVDLDKFVAFVSSNADRSRGWEPTGPRMFVNLSHLRAYAPAAQLEILAHELVHAVTREVSGPQVPTWMEEGLASFVGGNGGRPFVASAAAAPDDFPEDERFTTGSVTEIEGAYDQAQIAVEVMDDRFSSRGLVRFYETLGAQRLVAGTDDYWLDRALRTVRWTRADWISAWHRRLAR